MAAAACVVPLCHQSGGHRLFLSCVHVLSKKTDGSNLFERKSLNRLISLNFISFFILAILHYHHRSVSSANMLIFDGVALSALKFSRYPFQSSQAQHQKPENHNNR